MFEFVKCDKKMLKDNERRQVSTDLNSMPCNKGKR